MSLDMIQTILPMLFRGLRLTLLIAVVGIIFGTIIGSLCGYILQTERTWLKRIVGIYIWVIRATPLMVQALYGYYVLPKIMNIRLGSTVVGIIVIALNSGAFISEIVKGALNGIDVGQKEAAVSLGLTHLQTMIHVVIPPAVRTALPALFNQFIISVKDTALLSVIAVSEITQQANNYAALSLKAVPTYTVLALFYLLIISILIIAQKHIEKEMR